MQTFTFDGEPDGVALEIMTFESLPDGRSRIHSVSVGESVEGRDAMVASGHGDRHHRGLREARRAARPDDPGRGAPPGRRRLHRAGASVRRTGTPPAPVEGWQARDVVRHLVEWFPSFLEAGAGVVLDRGPSVDDDPVAAWQVHSDAVQRLLDDPTTAVEGAHQPAHRRGAAGRGGRPVLHRRRVHAHLGPGPGHRPGRDARPREVRGAARRHGADRGRAARQRPVRPAGRGARRTPTYRPGCSDSSGGTPCP